jgi:hypothetical protein
MRTNSMLLRYSMFESRLPFRQIFLTIVKYTTFMSILITYSAYRITVYSIIRKVYGAVFTPATIIRHSQTLPLRSTCAH